jgi:hypothetical protein
MGPLGTFRLDLVDEIFLQRKQKSNEKNIMNKPHPELWGTKFSTEKRIPIIGEKFNWIWGFLGVVGGQFLDLDGNEEEKTHRCGTSFPQIFVCPSETQQCFPVSLYLLIQGTSRDLKGTLRLDIVDEFLVGIVLRGAPAAGSASDEISYFRPAVRGGALELQSLQQPRDDVGRRGEGGGAAAVALAEGHIACEAKMQNSQKPAPPQWLCNTRSLTF